MERNKTVYTTASVAYGWAGAVMEVRSLFGLISHCVTDGPTDGRTDRVTYRVACTRLKIKSVAQNATRDYDVTYGRIQISRCPQSLIIISFISSGYNEDSFP